MNERELMKWKRSLEAALAAVDYGQAARSLSNLAGTVSAYLKALEAER